MKNLTSYFKLAVVMAVGFAFVACGKKDESKTASTPVGISGNGIGISGSISAPAELFRGAAYGTQSTPMSMSLQIVADGNLMNQTTQMYPGTSLINMYEGPAQFNMAISASTNIPFGSCFLPAGTFQVVSLVQGMIRRGYFTNLQFQLNNGVVFQLTDGNTATANGFGATIKMVQGPSQFQYGGAAPGITSCNDWYGFILAPQ
jgi:hypothetical protein